jgi:hypothetical protein
LKAAGLRSILRGTAGCRNLSSTEHAAMTHTISRLAPDRYGVLLGGAVIASRVWSGNSSSAAWIAEPQRSFDSLEEAQAWL